MRGVHCLVVVTCVGLALVVPTSASAPAASKPLEDKNLQDPSKVLMKREYLDPSYSPSSANNGYYYYYHPVEERSSQTGKKKEECGVLKILIPLIIITIFVGILAADSVGLIPQFQLPAIQIPVPGLADKLDALNAIKQGKRSIREDVLQESPDEGSSYASPYYEVYSWDALNKVTNFVLEAIEGDDCSSRLVCETGRYAEDRTLFVNLMEFLTPPIYENKMKVFKDSALNHTNCKVFQCGYVDDNSI